ncbi:hypothetical protein D3C85_1007670 [compost metagenome]
MFHCRIFLHLHRIGSPFDHFIDIRIIKSKLRKCAPFRCTPFDFMSGHQEVVDPAILFTLLQRIRNGNSGIHLHFWCPELIIDMNMGKRNRLYRVVFLLLCFSRKCHGSGSQYQE